MVDKMLVLVSVLWSATLICGRASMKDKIGNLNSVDDFERKIEELNDEAIKVRMFMDPRKPETIMEINAKSGTDEAIREYCKKNNCVEQGGDEILSKEQKKIEDKDNEIAANPRLARDPIRNPAAHWKRKTGTDRIEVPYKLNSQITENSKTGKAILAAIKEYKAKSCIDWVPVEQTDNPNQYHVEFIKGSGCYSYIGDARSFMKGKQPISIGQGCEGVGTVIHEMLHCMGFFHEQSRPDRDDYVAIHLENLTDQRFAGNFKKQAAAQIDSHGLGYDINSVMHYGPDYFAKPGTHTILKKVAGGNPVPFTANRRGFSDTDLEQLNKMYQCYSTGNPAPSPPPTTQPPTTLPPQPDSTCQLMASLGLCAYKKVCSICAAECAKVPKDQQNQLTGIINVQASTKCEKWANLGYCRPGHRFYPWMQRKCLKSCTSKNYPADGGCGSSTTGDAFAEEIEAARSHWP